MCTLVEYTFSLIKQWPMKILQQY